MKVHELIEELKKHPEYAEIVITGAYGSESTEVLGVRYGEQKTSLQVLKQVYIDSDIMSG